MKKQILTISVVIALMFLATMPTGSSDANGSGKVWSDGYVELILNKMERTDTAPEIFRQIVIARSPKEGLDFVVINLTVTRIKGRHILLSGERPLLFDNRSDNYTGGRRVQGTKLKGEKGEDITTIITKDGWWPPYTEAIEGSEWFLIFEMPKDIEPDHLRFIYNYTESWENVSIEEGEIEIDLQATSTPEEKKVPGFEVIFAIIGLLAISYLLRRRN